MALLISVGTVKAFVSVGTWWELRVLSVKTPVSMGKRMRMGGQGSRHRQHDVAFVVDRCTHEDYMDFANDIE